MKWDRSRSRLELAVKGLLVGIGEDQTRGGLIETPARGASAWIEWTSGYDQDPAVIIKSFDDGALNYDEMIFQGGFSFWSHCEHHLAPFFGVAHFGYIPKPGGRIVGLSKIPRLVDVFAKRLQVQERLTVQIVDAFSEQLDPAGVGLVLRCRHSCIESRGVNRPGGVTMTSALRGFLKTEPEARAEFMKLVDIADRAVPYL